MTTDDMALVREFAASESERAFEALVSRHVHLVYSAALRQTRDPHLAEEVTQAVFIVLARKAKSLPEKTVLSGWLYRTAQYASADALRSQHRRQLREQEAYMQSMLHDAPTDSAWEKLSPLLDEAMTRLRQLERDAIVLHYFENKNLREVGGALGLEERAAQKRIARALDKLRDFFARRGVVSTVGIIAGAISANSVQAAPVGLTATISATIVQGPAVTASILALVKGTLKVMTMLKFKTATVAIAGAILLAGATSVIVAQAQAPAAPPSADAKTEQQLMQLERDWSAAVYRHDTATVEKILADEFVGIDGRGIVTTKADEIEDARGPRPGAPPPPFTVVSEVVTDMTVRLYGDVAVVNGRVIEKVKSGERDGEIQYRRTTVWVKRADAWKCVSFHGSRIMEPGKR
jgi:RNA polymerase sigma factor (sigma-70 family)